MYIRVDDGVVVFATHFIRASFNYKRYKREIRSFQKESDGVVIYPGDDIDGVCAFLQANGIDYVVEQLSPDPLHVQKAKGIKYTSRTEAIDHILNDKEPERMVVYNLKKSLAEKDELIKSLEIRLLKIELKGGVQV